MIELPVTRSFGIGGRPHGWLSCVLSCLSRCIGWVTVQKTAWLIAGLSIFVFAFVSPLGVLADGFRLAAHMIQHLLLLLVVPLCLVLSLPRNPAWQSGNTFTFKTGILGVLRKTVDFSSAAQSSVGCWVWGRCGFACLLVMQCSHREPTARFRPHRKLSGGRDLFWWPICSQQGANARQ